MFSEFIFTRRQLTMEELWNLLEFKYSVTVRGRKYRYDFQDGWLAVKCPEGHRHWSSPFDPRKDSAKEIIKSDQFQQDCRSV